MPYSLKPGSHFCFLKVESYSGLDPISFATQIPTECVQQDWECWIHEGSRVEPFGFYNEKNAGKGGKL